MDEPARKRRKSGIEKLNVGGVRICTTRETLEMLPYFQALFQQEEDLGRSVQADDEGCLFVDRNGELFKVIIEYLRTFRRPPKEVLETRGIQLRDEAEFYGCSELLNELDGLTNVHKLEQRDRNMREAELALTKAYENSELSSEAASEYLVDVFKKHEDFKIQSRSLLGYPLLLEHQCPLPPLGSSSIIPSNVEDFKARFKMFAGNLLELVGRDPAVVVAGGSVVAALVEDAPQASSSSSERSSPAIRDVDVFLCGVSPERAETLLDGILTAFSNCEARQNWSHIVRSNAAVTLFPLCYGHGPQSSPLQVMLTLYRDPLEVVLNFDIDSCSVLFHPHTQKLLCTPRCHRALNFRTNVVDTDLRSEFYEKRLDKYARRGFCVAVPGLDSSHFDAKLLQEDYLLVEPLNYLLRLRPEKLNEKEVMPFSVSSYAGEMRVTNERKAVIVPHSLERILILDSLRVTRTRILVPNNNPFEDVPKGHFHFAVPADGPKGAVTWITFPEGEEQSHTGSEVSRFMQHLQFEHLLAQPPQADNLEALPESNLDHARGSGYETLFVVCLERLKRRKPLGFVFCRRPFLPNREPVTRIDQLDYIHDAARAPLRTDLSDAEFEVTYGVQRRLAFHELSPADYARWGRRAVNGRLRGASLPKQRPFMQGVYTFAP